MGATCNSDCPSTTVLAAEVRTKDTKLLYSNQSVTSKFCITMSLSDLVQGAYSGLLHVRMALAISFNAKMKAICTKSTANLPLAVFNTLLDDANVEVHLQCLQNLAGFF